MTPVQGTKGLIRIVLAAAAYWVYHGELCPRCGAACSEVVDASEQIGGGLIYCCGSCEHVWDSPGFLGACC